MLLSKITGEELREKAFNVHHGSSKPVHLVQIQASTTCGLLALQDGSVMNAPGRICCKSAQGQDAVPVHETKLGLHSQVRAGDVSDRGLEHYLNGAGRTRDELYCRTVLIQDPSIEGRRDFKTNTELGHGNCGQSQVCECSLSGLQIAQLTDTAEQMPKMYHSIRETRVGG
eukprot:752963-Hanusia_phi.AAC.1